ncbi:MAG: phosphoglycerate dehydrogenase, partial [Candidatus Eisenbacteria bacterium]
MSVKVLVSDPLSERAVAILRETPGIRVDEYYGLSETELLPLVSDIDAWVVRGATKVTRRLIEAAPKLRWVARAGAGIDNIDGEAAR